MNTPRNALSCAALALVLLVPVAADSKDCLGACGAGCSDRTCSTQTQSPDTLTCDPDGTAHVTQHLVHHCFTSDCCYWHDGCQRDCDANNPTAACYVVCGAGALTRGCSSCYGSGYIGCDPNGSMTDIEPFTQPYTYLPPNNLCPPPVCQGSCPAGFTWDSSACRCACSGFCDTCFGCNACGDCPPPPPPPCDDTCNGCGTYSRCGRYCGDCPVDTCFDTCVNCYGCAVCGACYE